MFEQDLLCTFVLSVFEQLAKFTNIQSVLVVGGLSMSRQHVLLRGRPDIVVATPARVIDHLLNSQDVGFEDTEV
jgi:ATP-dependent RNA helicase DDX27